MPDKGKTLKMRTILILGLIILAAVSLVTGTRAATAIIDPHSEPANCPSCHVRPPTSQEARSGEYMLLGDGIDATCHVCHPYDCCRINSLRGHNHPSNVGKWDVNDFTVPKTLPLFNGLITCSTCHYHRLDQVPGKNYMMVRLVEVRLDRVDWTALCRNCHIGY